MSIGNTESPLFVWKLILVAIVISIALMFVYSPRAFFVAQARNAWAARLDRVQFEEGERGIIFLGNSLLRMALPPKDGGITRELGQFLSSSPKWKSIRAVNLALGGRQASDLTRYGDQLIATRPAAIVIQAEMIVTRRNRTPEPEKASPMDRVRAWSTSIRAPFARYFPAAGVNVKDRIGLNQLFAPAQIAVHTSKKKKGVKQNALEIATQLWSNQPVSPTDKEFLVVKNFIKKARAAGIVIVVLEVPVSETAVRLAPPDYLRTRSAALESMLRPLGGHHLRFPEILPDGYFTDYSHVRRAGQKKFFRWLYPSLSQVLLSE